jgi:hypothetical protein
MYGILAAQFESPSALEVSAMKKMLVAAAVLVLAGAAVAGAVHVKQSLCDGVCPLTGRPIAHHVNPTPAPVEATGFALPAADAQAPAAAAAADEEVCPVTQRHCCCPKRQECEQKAKQVEQAPPAPAPTENP